MIPFIARRLWNGFLTLAALATLTFFVMRLTPGGPFSRNRKISPEVQANIEAAFHLDEPVWQQFGRYLWGILRLDLGPSTRHRDYPTVFAFHPETAVLQVGKEPALGFVVCVGNVVSHHGLLARYVADACHEDTPINTVAEA